jgi:cobalt-zinc-cadmium efflux system outer membrane protein
LQAARERASSAELQISTAKRNVMPGIGVNVNGGYGAAPHQWDVGVGFSLPMPVIDRGQGTIPAARARAHQAEAYVNAVLVPAALRIRAMHLEVVTRRNALSAYLTLGVTSGDEMLTEAQAGYVAGRFSVLELADAFRAWRDARLRLIELATAARQAEIDLGRTVGRPLREIAIHQDDP